MVIIIALFVIAAVFFKMMAWEKDWKKSWSLFDKPDTPSAPKPEAKPEVVLKPLPPAKAVVENAEPVPSPLVVKDLADNTATLLIRHRPRKGVATAHLIVWSGRKKRRMQDSYYDLVVKPASDLGDRLVDEFVAIAMNKLDEIKEEGRRKRSAKLPADAAPAEVAQLALPIAAAEAKPEPVPAPQGSSDVVVENNTPPDPSIKLRKFPSVHRGVILKHGMMPNIKDGREFLTYGVQYRTAEGLVDTVFGVNLKTALRDARARTGDEVEILKIGRKTIEEGKAPMNLFTVSVINKAAAAA